MERAAVLIPNIESLKGKQQKEAKMSEFDVLEKPTHKVRIMLAYSPSAGGYGLPAELESQSMVRRKHAR